MGGTRPRQTEPEILVLLERLSNGLSKRIEKKERAYYRTGQSLGLGRIRLVRFAGQRRAMSRTLPNCWTNRCLRAAAIGTLPSN